jgi:hypothetical protein
MRAVLLCSLLLCAAPAVAETPAAPPALVPVTIQLLPAGTQVSIDGEPVDIAGGVVQLPEGRHHLLAVAPVESGHDFLEIAFDARPGMRPIRRVLPRLAALRVRAPLGYAVRFDEQLVGPGRPVGDEQELTVRTSAGVHRVTAESERGRVLRARAELWPGRIAEVRLGQPSIVPGLVIALHGLAAVGAGALLLGLHGQCSSPGGPEACTSIYDFSLQPNAPTVQPPLMGYITLGLGGAALAAGTIWLAVNAAHRPRPRR